MIKVSVGTARAFSAQWDKLTAMKAVQFEKAGMTIRRIKPEERAAWDRAPGGCGTGMDRGNGKTGPCRPKRFSNSLRLRL